MADPGTYGKYTAKWHPMVRRNFIASRASVCEHCGRDVPKARWIWESPENPPQTARLIGAENVYRGYTYVAAENGEAELKLSSGAWRKFSSTDDLVAYVDALTGNRRGRKTGPPSV